MMAGFQELPLRAARGVATQAQRGPHSGFVDCRGDARPAMTAQTRFPA